MAFQAKSVDKYFLINLLCGLVGKYEENEPVTGTYINDKIDVRTHPEATIVVRHPTFDNGLVIECEKAADEHAEAWDDSYRINNVKIDAGKFGWEVTFIMERVFYPKVPKINVGVSCLS